MGPEVPKEDLIWQDPLPAAVHTPTAEDIATLKTAIADAGLSVSELVSVAWASASTFRGGDKRAAPTARLALEPQKSWPVNAIASRVLPTLQGIQQASGKASLADIIVLAGVVGVSRLPRRRAFRLAFPPAASMRVRIGPMWKRWICSRWPMVSATIVALAAASPPKRC